MKIIKTIIIFHYTICILPVSSNGQNIDTTNRNRPSLGIVFSPDYCYRSLKSDGSYTSDWIIDQRNQIEKPKFSYNTGLSVSFKIFKNIILEGGVVFSDKGERSDLSITDVNGQNIGKLITNYHYEYFDVPLKINYFLKKNAAFFYFSTGVSINFFYRQRMFSVITYDNGQTETYSFINTKDYNRLNIALIVGAGYIFSISKNIFIKIEPQFNRSINSIIDAPIKSYLYSIGIATGIYYNF